MAVTVTVDWTAAKAAAPGGWLARARSPATTATGATNALPAGWYSKRSPSWTSTSMVSPAAISLNRFTSGGTLIVSDLPSSSFSVSLRAAVSTASTVAVILRDRTAAASPGTPVE